MPAIVLTFAGAKKAQSISELAARIRAHVPTMLRSWDTYNAAARGGDDPLGKSRDLRHVLDKPPYYALDISVGQRGFPCPAITLGGLRVDETTGGVVNASGVTIPGLYAAGRAAVGIASNQYVSGLALADCIWSGRRAGRSASATSASVGSAVTAQ